MLKGFFFCLPRRNQRHPNVSHPNLFTFTWSQFWMWSWFLLAILASLSLAKREKEDVIMVQRLTFSKAFVWTWARDSTGQYTPLCYVPEHCFNAGKASVRTMRFSAVKGFVVEILATTSFVWIVLWTWRKWIFRVTSYSGAAFGLRWIEATRVRSMNLPTRPFLTWLMIRQPKHKIHPFPSASWWLDQKETQQLFPHHDAF